MNLIESSKSLAEVAKYDNAGYIYPNSRQAASVVAAFRMELMRLHVDVKTGISITEIKAAGITTKDTNSAANPVTNKKTDDRTGYCIQTDKGSFTSVQATHRWTIIVMILVCYSPIAHRIKWISYIWGTKSTLARMTISLLSEAPCTAKIIFGAGTTHCGIIVIAI